MHLAAYGGHAEICVLLYMEAPEVLHWRDDKNATPVMRSVDQGQVYAPLRTLDFVLVMSSPKHESSNWCTVSLIWDIAGLRLTDSRQHGREN